MNLYQQQNPQSIKQLFSTLATRYDFTNGINSFGLHKLWNKRLIGAVLGHGSKNAPFLDLCCGTGAIGLTYLRKEKQPQKAYMIDFCEPMLQQAKEWSQRHHLQTRHHIEFTVGDATELPLADNSVDRATVAYGIRNVADPFCCLQQLYRVVQPGGIVGILELTRPTNSWLQKGHSAYLRYWLPLMGKLCTANSDAYRYLCDTIHHFVSPEQLKEQMREVGFTGCTSVPLSCGIAHLIIGRK